MSDTITVPRSVVKQALAVLEYAANDVLTGRNAATALREALEQPQAEQEPVAWQGRDGYLYHFIEEPKPGDRPLYTHPQNLRCKSNQARLATLWGYEKKQPRQPLTDDEIERLWYQSWGGALPFARNIERIYGIGE